MLNLNNHNQKHPTAVKLASTMSLCTSPPFHSTDNSCIVRIALVIVGSNLCSALAAHSKAIFNISEHVITLQGKME